jgi:S1-C subfamily serine protease
MTLKTKAIGLFILFAARAYLVCQTPEATSLYEQNKEGVLALYVYGADKKLVAKGMAFGLSDGVIVTSYHLVSQGREVEGINVKGKKTKVEGIISVDRNLDIAILKIKGRIQDIALGNSADLKPGARIFAIGANETGDIVISEGTLRNLHQLDETQPIIEPSLSISEGFNGGPLLDLEGKAIGLVLILEKTGRVIIPVNSWKNLPRGGKVTAFKDWAQDDYFNGFEGAYLAGRIFASIDDLGKAER